MRNEEEEIVSGELGDLGREGRTGLESWIDGGEGGQLSGVVGLGVEVFEGMNSGTNTSSENSDQSFQVPLRVSTERPPLLDLPNEM